MSALENTSQVILRQKERLLNPVFLMCPPIDRLQADLFALGHNAEALCWDYMAYQAQTAALTEEHKALCRYSLLLPATDETSASAGNAPKSKGEHAILFMPKAKESLELFCAVLADRLSKAQKIWLVGEKREGIESAAKKLKSLGWTALKVDSARHCQLWEITPANIPVRNIESFWQDFSVTTVEPQTLKLSSLPGVFSSGRLDDGTRLLLDVVFAQPQRFQHLTRSKARVLDFGCGCGVVGLSLKQQWRQCLPELVDVNLLALESARRSAESQQLEVKVYASDGLDEVLPGLAGIVTNPPFHQGVKQDTRTTQKFLQDCRSKLKSGGTLTLVANRFLPYADWIAASLAEVEVIGENSRYKVYHAKKL